MSPPSFLAFAGSLRTESLNKKLIRVAARAAAGAGARVDTIDLRDFPLPIYDGDLEAADGLPANARRLKDLFIEHQGLLIACPEYNSSITAVLKNTIDWVSRQDGTESGTKPYEGKVAALFSASPGNFAALRSMEATRGILIQLGVLVVPQRLAVPRAHQAFADDGTLREASLLAALEAEIASVIDTVTRMNA